MSAESPDRPETPPGARPPDPASPHSPLGAAGGPAPAAPAGWGSPLPPPTTTRDTPWRWWQGVLGLATGAFAVFFISAIIAAIAVAMGVNFDKPPPALTIALVFVQDTVFIAVAVGFAAISARPRLPHFGLRRTRFWSTVGWALLGAVLYFAFVITYNLIVGPQGEQTTAEDLGFDRGTVYLILGGLVTIVLAPIGEEFFFRAFLYRSLRNSLGSSLGRLTGALIAAVTTSSVFMLFHLGSTPVAVLPILGALGVTFCLVYEKTGSLFIVIGLHATQNFAGFLGATKGGWPVGLGFYVAMIIGCILVPRLLSRAGDPPAMPGASRAPAW